MQNRPKKQPDARAEYEAALHDMRQKLDALMQRAVFVRGIGELSSNIHWGHVGDIRRINALLDEAISVKLVKIE
ncbi:hypothetical protein KC734_07675 [candidate division KSB1 bacterium]|nr:hypothetical protein [candidate division KSB1 bacterium]